MCRAVAREAAACQYEAPCTRGRGLGILRKYLVFVEIFRIVRHKLLRLLFALKAGEMKANFVRLKYAPHLGDEPG
jgi:hypothetical protein